MKRNNKLQQAKVFIQKQIVDLENMLEILDEYDSLSKTVELQEQKIQQLERSINELDSVVVSKVSGVPATIFPENGILKFDTLSIPIKSGPPAPLEDYDAIEAAAARLEESMLG